MTRPVRGGRVTHHQGADDNASGVACLLSLAEGLREVWSAEQRPLGLVLALTDGEEWGLLGSRRLVETLRESHDVRAVINVDSIGRAVSKSCHVIGISKHPTLATPIEAALRAEGLKIGREIDRFAYPHGSDHWPFHEAGIPAVTIWASDYKVMNTAADTLDKVESEGIARIARALRTIVLGTLEGLGR